MSDTEPTPEPSGSPPRPVIDHAPEPPQAGPAPVAAARRRGGPPLPLTQLLAAGLGGGLYWVWANPKPVQTQEQPSSQPAIDAVRAQFAAAVQAQAQSLGQQMQALSSRVDALEKQPAGAPAQQPGSGTSADQGRKLDDLTARVDALEKPSAAAGPAVQGVGADVVAGQAKRLDDIASRLDALSAKQDSQAAEIQKTADIAAQQPPAAAAPPPDTTAQQVPALIAQQQAADLNTRLNHGLADQKSAFDQAQAQQTAATDALNQRLAKLEQGSSQASQQDQAAQQGQEQAKAALAALGGRLDKVEQGSGQASQQAQQQAQAAQQGEEQAKTALAAVTARLDKLEQGSNQASQQVQQQAEQQAQAAQQGQDQAKAAVAALNTRVDKLEQGAGQAQTVARDAGRAIRIEAAQAALAAGQPLGAIPDAPPALARFATAAPPTESGLREDFPRVAAAARAASQPDLSHRSFLDRALARVQQSVTVRRGDRVLVGDPASGVLARAQNAVDAGDLKGAADTLAGLNGAAAAATRDWVDQVHALLEARASLAAMARG